MSNLEDYGKQVWFENNGYEWDARIESYVHRQHWKIFSKHYIDDHSFDTLQANVQEGCTPNQWKIYVNTESPLDVHNVHAHYGVGTGFEV